MSASTRHNPLPATRPGRLALTTDGKGPGSTRIAVIGAGHLGLVTAACLASLGHRVTVVDRDAQKVLALQRSEVDVHEPGLADMVAAQTAAARLEFTCDSGQAASAADIVFVAVGAPPAADASAALEPVEQVCVLLCAHLRDDAVVVLRSTLPVGAAQCMQARLASCWPRAGALPRVLSNPGFLSKGTALHDFLEPQRIVVGDDADDDEARNRLIDVYAPLLAAGVPVVKMDTRSAELSKIAANAMLAVRISFVNEIAAIAEATGADIERVCDGIGSDARIGRGFLHAGLGYGGSSVPRDVAALRQTARVNHLRADMLGAAERVNGRQRSWPAEALQRDLGGWAALRGLHVAIWGLAFKPGTDDMHNAPGLRLVERLSRAGAQLALYDPAAMEQARALLGSEAGLIWCDSAAGALEKADVLVLVTEWPEFLAFPPAQAARALRRGTVFDSRNALDADAWRAAGLRVFQIGRPGPEPRGNGPADNVARDHQPHHGVAAGSSVFAAG